MANSLVGRRVRYNAPTGAVLIGMVEDDMISDMQGKVTVRVPGCGWLYLDPKDVELLDGDVTIKPISL